MKRKMVWIFAILLVISSVVTGCNSGSPTKESEIAGSMTETEPETESAETPTEAPTKEADEGPTKFSKWLDASYMELVPALISKTGFLGEARETGDNTITVDVNETSFEEYEAYLELLKENGFELYVDNGEGIDGSVYSASFVKDDLVLTAVHIRTMQKTYVVVGKDLPFSKFLFKDEEDIASNPAGAKTKLTMRELVNFGDGYVFHLKNGRFLVEDGGLTGDGENLVTYLESLVPAGTKPIIDCLLISHAHSDHSGFLGAFMENEKLADRIIVNEILYSTPSDRVLDHTNSDRSQIQQLRLVRYLFKTESGDAPKIIRPELGQRYYFNDVVMDIVWTQDFLPLEDMSGDFNDTSTYVMHYIEGQKLLFGADADWGTMRKMMRAYSSEYLSCDIFHVLHHGYNTWNDFTDYVKCTVAIDSAPELRSANAANYYLKDRVKEWLNWGDGGKVLTFPYKVGTAVTLPHIEK